VDTHAIWSSGVPKLARMSFNATLTIMMSSSDNSDAHIVANVIQNFDPRMVPESTAISLSA
jgi:hypothetical protein